MLVLTVAKGPDRGKVFELRGLTRVIIGRNSPEVKLNDIMISRYHARMKLDGGRWILRDLGSRNGTKLNNERMTKPTVLKTGDHIVTGYTEFEVHIKPDPVESPATVEPATITQDESDKGGASDADGAIDLATASDDAMAGASSSADIPVDAEDKADAKPSAVDASEKLPAREEQVSERKAGKNDPPQGEQASSDWMTAIESQIKVVQSQGWDDVTEDEEDEILTGAVDDGEIQLTIDDDQRSLLYFDEDEHWAEDVLLDDEEIINSLEEDGPAALLKDLPSAPPPAAKASALTKSEKPTIGGKRNDDGSAVSTRKRRGKR